jgi:caffeoyl-CoA O-methyltransferase
MIVDDKVEAYLHKVQPAPDPVLLEMEQVGNERGFPIIGPLVGRLCEQLARAIGAKRVFEMGSGFGYSTAWFARAVGPGGRVVHTEMDPKKADEARQWMARMRLGDRVEYRTGDATAMLRKDNAQYDVVFIDIDKEGYPDALVAAKDHVRTGGLIITDNLLWEGKVLRRSTSAATKAIQEYTQMVLEEPDLLTTILPVRDGVGVSLRLR